MPIVRVLPDEIVIEAEDGQTIMDAAHDDGLYWPTTCGGEGICTTCACTVEDGVEHLEPMGRGELKTLSEDHDSKVLASGKLRLACQARVHGDVTVTKRGVVRPE
jgi:2Fe-2S ferredoxin